METHDSEEEYRWELPPTVLQKWRDAIAADTGKPSEPLPPVVPYEPAA